MTEIVIEIYIEQTRLFQCDRFHYADFRDWNRDWICQILAEIGEKINHRTNTAIFYVTGSTVQKFGRAAQADCFREVGEAYEYLWRNNQYYLASDTVITNAACAAAAFIHSSSSPTSIIFVC